MNDKFEVIDSLLDPYLCGDTAPGLLGEMCNVVAEHWERRKGLENLRNPVVIWIANALIGNRLVSSTGAKNQLSVYAIAGSGCGKAAAVDFGVALQKSLGVDRTIVKTKFTSQKQVQQELLNNGGCVNWVNDDREKYVLQWSDTRASHLCGIDELIRELSNDSDAYYMPPPIVREYKAALDDLMDEKNIKKTLASGGVNYDSQGKIPESHDLAIEIKKAQQRYDLAKNGINRAVINTLFTSTWSKEAKQIICGGGADNGQVGRMWVVFGPDEREDYVENHSLKCFHIPQGLINQMKGMIAVPELIKWEFTKESAAVHDQLVRAIDTIRDGQIGTIAARQGEMIAKIACIVAFFDMRSRGSIQNGKLLVLEEHIYWAFGRVVDSLKRLDREFGGALESDGTVATEWVLILARIRDILDVYAAGTERLTAGRVKNSFFKAEPYKHKFPAILSEACNPKLLLKQAKNALFNEILASTKGPLWFDDPKGSGAMILRPNVDLESLTMTANMSNYLNMYVNGKAKNRWKK